MTYTYFLGSQQVTPEEIREEITNRFCDLFNLKEVKSDEQKKTA